MAYPKPGINKKGEPAKRKRPGIPLIKDDLMKLIPQYRGNISAIADSLGCERHTVHRRITEDAELTKALQDSRERRLDTLEESAWDRACHEKESALAIFLLKTQGRQRGYDQDETKNTAQNIATAAFEFIANRSKNPAES